VKVTLLSYTRNPQRTIYASARQCYSQESAAYIYRRNKKISSEKLKKFIAHLVERGHLSPLEHVTFTFAIEGISRVCTHQLVRHRLASYSQQSQRYVSMENCHFIVPPLIKKNPDAYREFKKAIVSAKEAYKRLQALLAEDKHIKREEINQDLRFILPQATETKIVMTMNVRELLHFLGERMCMRAQWEIRTLASKVYTICKKILPEVFSLAGPKCRLLKYCPEKYKECPLYGKYF